MTKKKRITLLITTILLITFSLSAEKNPTIVVENFLKDWKQGSDFALAKLLKIDDKQSIGEEQWKKSKETFNGYFETFQYEDISLDRDKDDQCIVTALVTTLDEDFFMERFKQQIERIDSQYVQEFTDDSFEQFFLDCLKATYDSTDKQTTSDYISFNLTQDIYGDWYIDDDDDLIVQLSGYLEEDVEEVFYHLDFS